MLRRGTYTDGGIVVDAVMRAWSAVLTAGGVSRAWATGRTCMRLLDLPLVDDDDPATEACDSAHDDVAVSAARRVRSRTDLRVVRLAQLPPADDPSGACPTVSLERALVDLAPVVQPAALVCVLDAALHRESITVSALEAVVTGRHGRPEAAALRAAMAALDGRAESPAETLARLLLLPALPGLTPQVRVHSGDAILARLDLADEQLRLAVEVDGKRGHAGELMVAKDRQRDARTRAEGWSTERVTWFELRCRPEQTRARVLARSRELQAS